MKTEKNYYNSRDLVEVSRRGYYSEKISFITRNLSKIKLTNNNLKILDIASNDGYLASMYKNYGEVTVSEMNKEGIALCKKKGLNCIEGDFFEIPESYNRKFDVVIATDIIEHEFDTDEFLSKINKLLKKNGVLLLTTANVASFARRIMLLLGINPFLEFSTLLPYKNYNVGHIRYYTLKNLYSQLKMCNFSNIKITGDKINFSSKIYSRLLAKIFPTFARNILAFAIKNK